MPRPFRVADTRARHHDTVTLELGPRTATACRSRPGSSRCCRPFGVGEVPISISGDPAGPACWCTRSATSAGSPGRLCQAQPGDVLGCPRPVRRGVGGVGRQRAATSSSSPVAIGLAPLRPAVLEVVADRGGVRPGGGALRRPHAGRRAVRRRAATPGRRTQASRSASPSTAPPRRGPVGSGW